jgi:hypothetical protein
MLTLQVVRTVAQGEAADSSMSGKADSKDAIGLCIVLTLILLSSWYPYRLDLPTQARNAAVHLPDGTWKFDGASKVTAEMPQAAVALLALGRFELTVVAQAEGAVQAGPARILSTGRDPYDPSAFMIGLERDEVVLRLPCGPGAPSDAEWRFATRSEQEIQVTLWLDAAASAPLLRLGQGQSERLSNPCPLGSKPRLPDGAQQWVLGNVLSGHRPFKGHLLRLELNGGGQSIDLLREVRWLAPTTRWMLPERLYEPMSWTRMEALSGSWHFVSFMLVGYLLAGAACARQRAFATLAMLGAFALVVSGGKLLIADRHVSLLDLTLSLLGGASGVWAQIKLGYRQPVVVD